MDKPTPTTSAYDGSAMVLTVGFSDATERKFKGANQDHHDRFGRVEDKTKFFNNEIDGKFEEVR